MAGRDPSPSLSGLEDWKVLMGGLQSDAALAPPTAQGGQGGQVEVTIFSFKNQSRYSQGMEVAMPAVPGSLRVGGGACAPAEAEPSHGQGGRCLLQVSGAGGAVGPGPLPQEPHVVVGCLWAWGVGGENGGLGAPKAHRHAWLIFPWGMQFSLPK